MVKRKISPPPPLQPPTAKEKRYDRQLRLWAASGQQALEDAHVLLLNSGPGIVGVETLKNLILPGIGNYTIVDEVDVSEKDLGVNFFLDESSLGKSRAEETCKFLQELNPEVNGSAIQTSIESFVEDLAALDTYSLILLIGPIKDSALLQKICDHARRAEIPLFYIHCIGFFSHFSVQLPEYFPIVETHPDPALTHDLRILNPWKELTEFQQRKTLNLDVVDHAHAHDDHNHGHVPMLLLLLHYVNWYKIQHRYLLPETYAQKQEVKSYIDIGTRRNNAEGGEENFEEAAAAVIRHIEPPSASPNLREVFDCPKIHGMDKTIASFWLIAIGVRDFPQEHNGLYPLPGTIPDMKAQSEDYIALQNLYKTKARSDLAWVVQVVRDLEEYLEREPPIPAKEIEAFIKNAQHVKLIHGRPIRVAKCTEDIDWRDRTKPLSQELRNPSSLLPIYFAFLALDRHHDDLARLQNLRETPNPLDTVNKSRDISGAHLPPPNFGESAHFYNPIIDPDNDPKPWPRFDYPEARLTFENVVQELERADGAELHNVAALTGGMVAQEVIKVLTKQYVPVDNTCVYDGIAGRTAVFNI